MGKQATKPTVDGLEQRYNKLEERVAGLEYALEYMASTDVTTRRLVVIGPDGFERVVIDANEHNGGVTVHSKEGDCNAHMGATEEVHGGDAHVSVSGSDQVLAMMTVNKRDAGHEGEVWLQGMALTRKGLVVDGAR
jgi:hypothetical protein